MKKSSMSSLVVNGWTIFAHSLFIDQVESLIRQVEAIRLKDPSGYLKKNSTKRLAVIARLAFEVIPQDPTRAEYRLGNTLGDEHKHWFRIKFFQQYRMFFRYHSPSRVIVYVWVNDEVTKRAHDSCDDAYRIFGKMLESGHPPDDLKKLLTEAQDQSARLQKIVG